MNKKNNEKVEEKNYKKSIIRKILISLVIILVILLFGISNVNGVISVVSEKPTNNKYTINCLGDDNLITLYGKDEDSSDKDDVKLIYSSSCKSTKTIYAPYIERAVKLNIVNGEDEDNDRINYVEYFDRIYQDEVNIQLDTFTNEFCFTILLNRYADIKILGDTEQNVKDYYKCYSKESVKNIARNDDSSSSVVVPVYIDDELQEEFIITKPKEDMKISFQDLGLISDKLDDKMIVTIKNPSNIQTNVKVVDSNLPCHTKSFTISDEYKLYCNQSQDDNNYFIQIQNDNKEIFYNEYQRPPEKKDKGTDIPPFAYLIGLVVIGVIALNIYNKKAKGKDRSAIEELESRQNDQ